MDAGQVTAEEELKKRQKADGSASRRWNPLRGAASCGQSLSLLESQEITRWCVLTRSARLTRLQRIKEPSIYMPQTSGVNYQKLKWINK